MPERGKVRKSPRYAIPALVDYTSDRVVLRGHKLHNISLGGLSLLSDREEETGAMASLLITFPELDNVALAVQGEVVRVNGAPPGEIAVKWVNIDDAVREKLRTYLATIGARKQE